MEQVLNQNASRVKILQLVTIGWMTVELGIALFSGIRARSIALTAFGADSAIELMSAVVVLRRFSVGPGAERSAARISGLLLYALGASILVSGILSLIGIVPDAQPTVAGTALLIAAAVIMPLLGGVKRKLARETASRALNADAAQSNICAYMAWIALAGLLLNLFFRLRWADPAAALLLLPIVLKEAEAARRGEVCECC